MQLIRSLDDPRLFRKKPNVRVFGAHTRTFPATEFNGQQIPECTVTVTEADLHQIAANCNRSYLYYAQLAKLFIGHRLQAPGTPEHKQPPTGGYARNFRVQPMPTPSGKYLTCLICDEYHDVKHLAECDKHTGRSPEYLPDAKLITGIAMLTRDPALQLGFVAPYSNNRFCYSMGAMNAMPEPIQQEPPKDKPVPYMDEEGAYTDEDEQMYRRYKRYARRYSAESGMATPPAPMPTMPDQGQAAYGSPSNAVLYALQQQNAALQRANVQANAARMLDVLVPQVRFDYNRELQTLVSYQNDQQRAAHIQYMMSHYEKLPGSGMLPIAYSAPQAAATGIHAAPSNHDKAMQYMRSHPGMDYFAALEKVGG